MSRRSAQTVAHMPRRTVGRRVWRLAPSCLIILVCAAPWQGSATCQADQRLDGSSPLVAGVPDDGLHFVPSANSRVELQGSATIGDWKSRSTDIHGQVVLDT